MKDGFFRSGELYSIRDMRWLISRRYGRRNRLFLQGLTERVHFLLIVVADLHDAVRKGYEKCYPVAFARIIAGISGIVDHFDVDDLPLEQMMSRKYPSEMCVYCGHVPCDCPERRGQAKLASQANFKQMNWPLYEWCKHLDALYGAKNRTSGIDNVIARLLKEVVEILALKLSASHFNYSARKLEEEFALEIADVIAWTIGAANLLGVNLSQAIKDRYEIACPDCQESDCVCTKFDMAPMDWKQFMEDQQVA